jgi:AcrR family transcriptional regulator
MIVAGRKAESEPDDARHDERLEAARPRPRGRPARLSRDRIVDAVLAMLEQTPGEALTAARIAREVEAVPAALYRHFDSLDDLLDHVLARVLATSERGMEAEGSWEAQLESWMHGLRRHLLQYPAVIALIGRSGRTSPAWLDASSTLVEILERAGLTGHDLAGTYLWILETTVGLIMQEAVLPLPQQIANARASRHELSEHARARFSAIAPELERLDGDTFFSFAVAQATALIAMKRADSGSD